MQTCCHFLCGSQTAPSSRINDCYPPDGRSSPILAKQRELISWATHDLNRITQIDELLFHRITQDVSKSAYNNVNVGVKILVAILQEIPENNYSSVTSLTSLIINFIRSKLTDLIAIATETALCLIEFGNERSLATPVRSIVLEFVSISSEVELRPLAFLGISSMLSRCQIEWIPLTELFPLAAEQSQSGSWSILLALAKRVRAISLHCFSVELIRFFNESNLWDDVSQMTTFLFQIFSEIDESISPALYCAFLEVLPPSSGDVQHCHQVLDVSLRLFAQISPSRLVSLSHHDELTIVLSFVHFVPSLQSSFKKELIGSAFNLVELIVPAITKLDLIQHANSLYWEFLPAQEDQSRTFNENKFCLTIQFLAIFVKQAKAFFDKQMIIFGLSKLLNFCHAFTLTNDTMVVILKFLAMIKEVFPNSIPQIIIPFLFSLQNEAPRTDMGVHTLVMLGFIDLLEAVPPEVSAYIESVVDARFAQKQIQALTKLPVLRQRLSSFSKKAKIAKQVTIFFEYEAIKAHFRDTSGEENTFRKIPNRFSIILPPDELYLFSPTSALANSHLTANNTTLSVELESLSSSGELPQSFVEAMNSIKPATFQDSVEAILAIPFEWRSSIPIQRPLL